MKKTELNPIKNNKISYYQHTLKNSFTCIGRGLHTGINIIMRVMPAEDNTGYTFIRRDLPPGRNEIKACWHTVGDTHLSTTITNKLGARVSTIEHLASALQACGVDNATIVLDGPEVPVMDGSAAPFVELIENAGLQKQDAERKAIVILNQVTVREGNKLVSLTPSDYPVIDMYIDFDTPVIGQQRAVFEFNKSDFIEHIASARTFGFKEQVDTLQKLGFARGGSLRNAVLIDGDTVLNQQGLRYSNEFVRHKILDNVGDLALAGGLIFGRYTGRRSGHALNNQLLRELMSNSDNYEYRTIRQIEQKWLKQQRGITGMNRPEELLQNEVISTFSDYY